MALPKRAQGLLNTINKELKQDIAIVATDIQVANSFTSGSLAFDVVLGGGWAADRWHEIYGPFSAGKTTIVNKTLAANMARNENFCALWVAAEHYDKERAEAAGVDLDRTIVVPVNDMATGFEVMLEALSERAVDAIVLDSYHALIPSDEAEKGMGEFVMASGAKLMNKFCRKAHAIGQEKGPPFLGLIINQTQKTMNMYGPPEVTPGGSGKDYFYWSRVKLKRVDWIEEKRPGYTDPLPVGQEIALTTTKNKSASPMQTAKVDYYFRRAPSLGFSRGDYDLGKDYVNTGKMFGIIEGSTWLSYKGQKWQGKAAMIKALRDDPELMHQLEKEVLEAAKNPAMADRGPND